MAANVDIVIKATDKASREIRKAGDALKGVEGKGKNAARGMREVDDQLSNLKAAAIGATGVIIALGAAAKKVFDLSQEGAIINQTTESFDRMNDAVFKTPNLLKDMQRASRGTIKDLDLMRGVLTLTAGQADEVAQQFAQGAPKLLEIAKAANKLNPLLGDTAFLFESLSLGIKRQSPLILDNLGLTVKVGEANQKYADSLGKSVEELTAAEKQQALFNEVLRAGDVLISQVGGNVDSQVDSYAQLTTAVSTLKDEAKKLLAEGLGPQVKAAAESIRVNKLYADALTNSEVSTRELVSAFVQASRHGLTTSEQIDLVTRAMDELAKGSELTAGELVNQMVESDRLAQAYGFLIKQYQLAGIVTSDLADDTEELTAEQKKLREELDKYQDTQRRNLAGQESARRSAELLEKQYRKTKMEAGEFNTVVKELGPSLKSSLASGLSFLNEELDDLGPKLITVGGRTEDQNRILEQAQKEYDTLARKISDATVAPELFGYTAEEAAENIEKWTERQGELNVVLGRFGGITGTASFYTKEFTVNQDALEKAVFNSVAAIDGQSQSAIDLGLALGELNEEQAAAILKQIELEEGVKRITEAYVNEGLSADEAKRAIQLLSTDGIAAMEAFIEQAIKPASERAKELEAKIKAIGDAIDNLPTHKRIEFQMVVTGQAPDDLLNSQGTVVPGQIGGPPATGGSTGGATGGGAPQANDPDNPDKYGDFQHGGTFTVPKSQDYLLGLHQGEQVTITPKNQVQSISQWIDRFSSSLNKADLAEGITRYQHVLNELARIGSSVRGLFDSFLPGQAPGTDFQGLISEAGRRRKSTRGLIDTLLGDLGLQGASTTALKRLRDTGGGLSGEYRELFSKDLDRVIRLKDQERRLSAEILRLEEQRTKEAEKQRQLEQRQKTLDFLNAQIRLIDELNQRGLDPRQVLRGVTLGTNADPAQLASVTQQILEAVIKNINAQLKSTETRQMGGPVVAGRSYIVGERGPEYFTPGSSGYITPRGGGGATINIDARGASPSQVEQAVTMALLKQGVRAQSIQRRK